MKPRAIVIGIVLVCAAPFVAVRLVRQPSNDRVWARDQRALPRAIVRGDLVEIQNVRNFTYRSETDYTPRYETRTYDLRKLDSVWFVVEPFANLPGAAHTFLSFGFGDEYVSISVEIRKEESETYSPIKGLFRQYELMYVVGDERDLIGLRTNYRKDVVYLYPVRTTPEKMRSMFIDMLSRANDLSARPEFYNTVTSTCFTNIVRHVNRIRTKKVRPSFRILFPSNGDRLAYDLELIDTSRPFEEVRAAHRIDLIAQKHAIDDGYSRRIRAGGVKTGAVDRT